MGNINKTKDEIADYIKDLNEDWNGKSGLAVENLICREIDSLNKRQIKSGEYDGKTLFLKDQEGNQIIPEGIDITVVEPSYSYGIVLYGVRVTNGNVVTMYNTDQLEYIQYKKAGLKTPETKVEAGIGVISISKLLEKEYDKSIVVPVTLSLSPTNSDNVVSKSIVRQVTSTKLEYFQQSGQKYILSLPEGVSIDDALNWVDVTELFNRKYSTQQKLKAYFEYKVDDVLALYEDRLATQFQVEILDIVYNGSYITDKTEVNVIFQDDVQNSNSRNNYRLVGYNVSNDDKDKTKIQTDSGAFNIPLVPGLNKIIVRAEKTGNPNFASDWLKFDVICTNEFYGTAVAVNGISDRITNNGVATLYRMDIYSIDREEFELTTYLENVPPNKNNPQPTNIIKQETISASRYDRETGRVEKIEYKKYIELEQTGNQQYLLIKINDSLYTFWSATYSSYGNTYTVSSDYSATMEVEPCVIEYTYVKSAHIKLNYDQITGQTNNLFSTYSQKGDNSTLIQGLLESDGWYERDGLTRLRLSKQDKDVLRNAISLGLQDNFTIELGFSTYNISDNAQSILNIGKLILLPTQIGYLKKSGDIESGEFLKTNSQFQENYDTHVVITAQRYWNIGDEKHFKYYPDYLQSDQASFDQHSRNFSKGLMKIYINGCIDREIILEDAEFPDLKKAALNINPKSADIDLLLFRVYDDTALTSEEVIRNYVSFLPNKTGHNSKESIYLKNDILDASGKISWEKCLGKQNTLLFIYHDNGVFPNRFWGQADNESDNDKNKKVPCTLVINYADPTTNLRYGGVLDKLQCKGQGSSAMRYLIWNVNSSLNKFKEKLYDEKGDAILDEDGKQKTKKCKSIFKPYGLIYRDSGRDDLLPTDSQEFKSIEGYYVMPTYEGEVDKTEYKYTKMVGKVNFASSMQSHKQGACRLFDDAYKAKGSSLLSGGKKAVHEEAFMYFYVKTDIDFNSAYSSEIDANNITYDRILELGQQAKFMGFQTWGPGKGDDACSGYDEDATPEYLLLEGGENTEPIVNFQRPWQTLQRLRTDFVRSSESGSGDGAYNYARDLKDTPTVSKDVSIKEPWSQLLIDDESIVYLSRGAWDIDYGFVETEVGDTLKYFDFSEGAKVSLVKFREFFDTVYLYDPTYNLIYDIKTEDTTKWSIYKKYCILNNGTIRLSYQDPESNQTSYKEYQNTDGDVYRFDEASKSWVPAGLYFDNGKWERLNYSELIYNELGESYNPNNEEMIKSLLMLLFKNKISGQNGYEGYVDLQDIAFHQAFIKFLSGTDNRAKNTYFQIIGKLYEKDSETGEWVKTDKGDYKIRLIGDDLDTILVTDNSGLQSKPYNLIEDSYYSETDPKFAETYKHWGDVGNLFFRQFDKCFESDILGNLNSIMTKAAISPSSINTRGGSYFYNQFFNVQESFPEIAYNHTSQIYYEAAYVIKNCGASYSFTYTNNDVDPISQSHGSCLQCEKQFMKERLQFLAGYALSDQCLDNGLSTGDAGASGVKLRLKLDFTPVQDFYPTYFYDKAIKRIGNNYYDSEYVILRSKAEKGVNYSQEVVESAGAINQRLYQTNLYKKLTLTGLLQGNLSSAKFDALTSFTLDNDIIEQNPSLFESEYPRLSISAFPQNIPSIEELNIRNISMSNKLDISNFYKLKSLDLTGSTITEIILPQTNSLQNIILPESLEIFEIYNNPGLTSVDYSTCKSLKTVYIDCAKCGDFNVEDFIENFEKDSLVNITLKNLNGINLTEECLMSLLKANCNLQGTINIVNSVTDKSLKNISFKTLEKLVTKFGDIRSEANAQNSLCVKFTSSSVSANAFKYPQIVNTYYQGKESVYYGSDIFNIDFTSGNNVAIKNGKLDITYASAGTFPDQSSIELDPNTGNITVKKQISGANNAYVKITVNTIDGLSITNDSQTKLVFEWVVPKVGDFAYADGTFSESYLSAKDLVGMIYKCDYDETTGSGIAYIVGCEYTNNDPQYLGPEYFDYTGSALESVGQQWGTLSDYANLHLNNIVTVEDESKLADIQIKASNRDNILYQEINTENLIPAGQEDTKSYINALCGSSYYLDFKQNVFSTNPNIQFVLKDGKHLFNDIQSLNRACAALIETSITEGVTTVESAYTPALLFPYFYSAYLYQPAPKNDELDPQYERFNWYAPSIKEMSMVLYYRIMSATNPDNAANIAGVNGEGEVNKEITHGDAIFAKAKSKMFAMFPTAWENMANYVKGTNTKLTTSVNAVTTKTSNAWSGNNYLYFKGASQYDNSYMTQWFIGDIKQDEALIGTSNYTSIFYVTSDYIKSRAHKYVGSKGLPFTHYNFKKPS